MKIVKFVLALSYGADKTRRLQNFKMLRDRLSRQPQLMLHRQSRAQLKERLTVPLDQFIQDRPSCRRNDRLEDVAHIAIIGKSSLACQDVTWKPQRP